MSTIEQSDPRTGTRTRSFSWEDPAITAAAGSMTQGSEGVC